MYNMRFVVTRQGYAAAIIFLFVVSKTKQKKKMEKKNFTKRRHYYCIYNNNMCVLNCKLLLIHLVVSKKGTLIDF